MVLGSFSFVFSGSWGSWWVLVIPEGSFWFLVVLGVHGGFWWFLVVIVGSWWFLVVLCGS